MLESLGIILAGFGDDSIWSSGVAQSRAAWSREQRAESREQSSRIHSSSIADFQMVIQASSPFHSSIHIILKIAITPTGEDPQCRQHVSGVSRLGVAYHEGRGHVHDASRQNPGSVSWRNKSNLHLISPLN